MIKNAYSNQRYQAMIAKANTYIQKSFGLDNVLYNQKVKITKEKEKWQT